LGILVCLVGVAADRPQYRTESPVSRQDWQALLAGMSAEQVEIVEKVNRVDRKNLWRLREVKVPEDWSLDEMAHSPLPRQRDMIEESRKMLVIDLDSQVFGAYEDGELVRWGPVSTGSRKSPTPPGLYHLNWRAKRHVSTSDSRWILHWYFNFENREGRALHAYEMPGYPASHSCIRLLDRDARWIHEWGEGWELSKNGREVLKKGTPLLIESVM